MKHLHIETIKGPWASLGIHVDLQAPCIDIHFWWWIVSIGHRYEFGFDFENEDAMKPNEVRSLIRDLSASLNFADGATITDRPDLCSIPDDVSWIGDYRHEIEQLDRLARQLL